MRRPVDPDGAAGTRSADESLGCDVQSFGGPLPPNTMFPSGTRAVLDELPETVRLATGVSVSPTVKSSGPAAPSSASSRA